MLADPNLRAKGLARGREGTEMERAIILSEFRRELSVAGAKAYSACLIGRVARVREGHRLAKGELKDKSFFFLSNFSRDHLPS